MRRKTTVACFRAGAAGRAGFTLLEMLIVIALIGTFTAVFVVNIDTLMRQAKGDSVETVFWRAARAARTRALLERQAQSLRFDAKAVAFVVEEIGHARAETFPVDREEWAPETELEVRFQKRVPPSQFFLREGELIEMREIAMVEFFPDGTCTPFSLALVIGTDEHTIEIDPWTGAQLLEADDAG